MLPAIPQTEQQRKGGGSVNPNDAAGDPVTFEATTILRLWAATREYPDPLQRAIVRAIVTHPHCKARDNGLTGRMTFTNAPTTEAMVNVWLGDGARGVRFVSKALDALKVSGALVERHDGVVTILDVIPSALAVDFWDSTPFYGLTGLEAA